MNSGCNYLVNKADMSLDLLIRLAPMQLPVPRGARRAQVLMPDGLEHPRFRHTRNGSGVYILCKKSFVKNMEEKRR